MFAIVIANLVNIGKKNRLKSMLYTCVPFGLREGGVHTKIRKKYCVSPNLGGCRTAMVFFDKVSIS